MTSANLTGEWSGSYSYPANEGPTTPFLADINDSAGHISGTIIEPDTLFAGPTMVARIAGSRHESGVDFTKTYVEAGRGYDDLVDYVGSLSADGTLISGVWSLLDFDGTFEMHRDTVPDEPAVEVVKAVVSTR